MAHAQHTLSRFGQPPQPPKVSRATRKDLFNLYGQAIAPGGDGHLKTLQSLAREGIRVLPAGDNHWIIRGNALLPEVHCYSVQELQRFARSQARYHLINSNRKPR